MSATRETRIIGEEQGFDAAMGFDGVEHADMASALAWFDAQGDTFTDSVERASWLAGFVLGWATGHRERAMEDADDSHDYDGSHYDIYAPELS